MATDKESLTVDHSEDVLGMVAITAPDLDELARLLEEATQRPWSAEEAWPAEGTWYGRVRGVYNGHSCVVADVDEMADTHLIAAAVNALPALLATARAAERLTAEWCKDGEPLAERIQRERNDSLALMGLLAREKQAHEATARRERRMWEALAMARQIVTSTAVTIPGLYTVLADIDAALAEEGQDG